MKRTNDCMGPERDLRGLTDTNRRQSQKVRMATGDYQGYLRGRVTRERRRRRQRMGYRDSSHFTGLLEWQSAEWCPRGERLEGW